MLTETAIRVARAPEKPLKLFDSGGLYLRQSDGSRWWCHEYRIAGREKLLSLGVYQDVSLKQARERRDDSRRMVAAGIDPSAKQFLRVRATTICWPSTHAMLEQLSAPDCALPYAA
jgi:hypothetical protein